MLFLFLSLRYWVFIFIFFCSTLTEVKRHNNIILKPCMCVLNEKKKTEAIICVYAIHRGIFYMVIQQKQTAEKSNEFSFQIRIESFFAVYANRLFNVILIYTYRILFFFCLLLLFYFILICCCYVVPFAFTTRCCFHSKTV